MRDSGAEGENQLKSAGPAYNVPKHTHRERQIMGKGNELFPDEKGKTEALDKIAEHYERTTLVSFSMLNHDCNGI